MRRPSPFALAGSVSLFLVACGGSSGGGNETDAPVEALRAELAAAGIEPLPAPPVVSDELFALGRALFFDKVLSGNEDVSCATCHLPQFGTSDGRTLSEGVHALGLGPNRGGGEILPRNSPSLFGLHLRRSLFWDGRVEKLFDLVVVPREVALTPDLAATFSPGLEVAAAQAMLPPFSRTEMRGMPGENPLADLGEGYDDVWAALTERLLDLPGYVGLLLAAYPGVPIQDFTFAHAANAIAAFETRAFARTESPFERFLRGDDQALTAAEVAGALEFLGPAGCARCHSGALFSDQEFHNIGLPQLGPGVSGNVFDWFPGSDIGRENATFAFGDRYRFRTPSLLNVELTAPYGHAGQFAELRDMVAHYQGPALSNRGYDIQSNVSDARLVHLLTPNSDVVLAALDPLLLDAKPFDVDAVVTFLRALTAAEARDLEELVPASVPSGLPVF